MARAYGSNAEMCVAFEAIYGTAPTSGFLKVPFISSGLGSEQGLIENDVLGYGRDPQAPIRDVINVDGDIVVPVDVRNFGTWLKSLLGEPTTDDNFSSGTITFAVNPSNDDTITINGVVFTLTTGSPTGNEIAIESGLAATMVNIVTALQASTETDVDDATYSCVAGSGILDIVHDVKGSTGDAFTLAASAATVSGATLSGGSAKLHTFLSGASSLPSMAIELGLSQASAFFMSAGVQVNTMAMEFTRSGGAKATFGCIGQSETRNASTQAGTPATVALTRFNQFQGSIKKDGLSLGNVTRSTIDYSNNMERIENVRNDGLVDGVDPTIAALTGVVDVRFASTALLDIATDGTAVALEFAYKIDASNWLIFTAHEVYLPKPKISVDGPGGVQASFDWQAADNTAAGQMMTVTLVNDVAGY